MSSSSASIPCRAKKLLASWQSAHMGSWYRVTPETTRLPSNLSNQLIIPLPYLWEFLATRTMHTPGSLKRPALNLPHMSAVSYTHLRAHETDSYLVCRLLLDKKKKKK